MFLCGCIYVGKPLPCSRRSVSQTRSDSKQRDSRGGVKKNQGVLARVAKWRTRPKPLSFLLRCYYLAVHYFAPLHKLNAWKRLENLREKWLFSSYCYTGFVVGRLFALFCVSLLILYRTTRYWGNDNNNQPSSVHNHRSPNNNNINTNNNNNNNNNTTSSVSSARETSTREWNWSVRIWLWS